jgi:dihydroorotate dehydrogenase (fumarate)
MKRGVRAVTRLAYRHAAKPILFRFAPDDVHHGLIKVGSVLQRTAGIRSAPHMWSHAESSLVQTKFGITFSNPVGLSAGFDKNGELVPLLQSVGFGFATIGSVTADACDGNPRPWFHRLRADRSLVVHAGLPNDGVDVIAERIQNYSHRTVETFPVIVSVAKTNSVTASSESAAIKDYCRSFKKLERTDNISMYELNISCPNTYGGEPFTTPERLDKLLSAVDVLTLNRPLLIKMPISLPWVEFKNLLHVINAHDVAGVTIGNLLKDRNKAKLRNLLSSDIKGGLSGRPTRDISTKLIKKTYAIYGDKLMIVGVGGVFSAQHAYEKIKAGATLVGMITGMIFEGPQIVGDINYGIGKLLARDGYETVAEAIGVDVKKA